MASLTSVLNYNKAGEEVPLQLLDSLGRGPVAGLLREHQHFPGHAMSFVGPWVLAQEPEILRLSSLPMWGYSIWQIRSPRNKWLWKCHSVSVISTSVSLSWWDAQNKSEKHSYIKTDLRLQRSNMNAFGRMGTTFVFWSFGILKNTRTGFTTYSKESFCLLASTRVL